MKRLITYICIVIIGISFPSVYGESKDIVFLIKAIENNNLKAVKKYIEGGNSVYFENEYGFTVLHIASYFGRARIISYLLNMRGFWDAYIIRLNNKYAVKIGSYKHKKGAVKLLSSLPKTIKKYAYIYNAYKKYYVLVGKYPTKEEAKKMLKIVKKEALNPNARTKNGNVPLHFSVNRKHFYTTKVLLLMRADPRIKNIYGISPIDIAKVKNMKKITALLMKRIYKPHLGTIKIIKNK